MKKRDVSQFTSSLLDGFVLSASFNIGYSLDRVANLISPAEKIKVGSRAAKIIVKRKKDDQRRGAHTAHGPVSLRGGGHDDVNCSS